MTKALNLFVDGACRGNPGPAGIGVVISQGSEVVCEISKPMGDATNNIAEYSALIFGLIEAVHLKADTLCVCSDSELLCRQISGKYKVKNEKLKFLYDQVMVLLKCFRCVKIKHIPREQNTQADQLATRSLKQQQSNPDDRPEVFFFGEESPSSKG